MKIEMDISKSCYNYDELLKASKDILNSWDENMHGDIEQLNQSEYEYYWSPAASMVKSEAINKLRQLVTLIEKGI